MVYPIHVCVCLLRKDDDPSCDFGKTELNGVVKE